MEDAIIRECIREEPIVESKPEFNIYIAEFVTYKKIKKLPFFREKIEINTKELILKYCPGCGIKLPVSTEQPL